MSDNLFNWNTKISQMSTGYGVTDDSNNNNKMYAQYSTNNVQTATDTHSKHSKRSTGTNFSNISDDMKTQNIPTDMQSDISSHNKKISPDIKQATDLLNTEISAIRQYKEDYEYRRKNLMNKIHNLGISNAEKILNIIEQYPDIEDGSSHTYNRENIEHFTEKQSTCDKKEENVSESIVNRAKSTVDFVHKCHVRYWWINAIVRIVTISVFLIMIYKLSYSKKSSDKST